MMQGLALIERRYLRARNSSRVSIFDEVFTDNRFISLFYERISRTHLPSKMLNRLTDHNQTILIADDEAKSATS